MNSIEKALIYRQNKLSKTQLHIKKHRIPEGKYIWLCSLWNETEPEKSEITLYDYKAVRDMWSQQHKKPMLSKRQMTLFNSIYERYQRTDMR